MRKKNLQIEQLENRTMLNADFGAFLPSIIQSITNLTYDIDGSGQVYHRIVSDPASIDGSGNNVGHPDWGSTDQQLLRSTSIAYGDGISTPAGDSRPGARAVSNAIVSQSELTANRRHLSDMAWLFGQFIDHDIDLTENGAPAEALPIEVPAGDPEFDPFGTGNATIDFNRSAYDPATGLELNNPRQQVNQITAYLDGSVVYGSDAERAAALRAFEGGRLKTGEGDLLPWNDEGLPNAGGPSATLFLAGDVRANENAALTAMHTIWVREHNRWADQISAAHQHLSDEAVYRIARAIVTAEIQAIAYNEFLPALLGVHALSPYSGYDASVNPGINNIFSTAAYRFGHSMLSPVLMRLNGDGSVIPAGNLPLEQAFFAPQEIVQHGVDSILLGAATQQAQEIDNQIVDSVRNFLFGPPGAGGFDLASLNIQRGRDHGLPGYNQARIDYGLVPARSFADITSNVQLRMKLEETYGSVDEIDVWVGGLAEDHVQGSSVGELFRTIMIDQFERIRAGDRLWYQNVFSGRLLNQINRTGLSDVIARNTDIATLQDNVFFDPSVLYHQAQNGQYAFDGSWNSTVRLASDGNRVMVLNQRTNEVLQSLPHNDVSHVMIVGTHHRSNDFTIDFSRFADAMPETIELYGGIGMHDRLKVIGSPAADQLVVNPGHLRLNGHHMTFDSVEYIVVRPGYGQDEVDIAADVSAHVTVRDPDGFIVAHDGHRQPGRRYVFGGFNTGIFNTGIFNPFVLPVVPFTAWRTPIASYQTTFLPQVAPLSVPSFHPVFAGANLQQVSDISRLLRRD